MENIFNKKDERSLAFYLGSFNLSIKTLYRKLLKKILTLASEQSIKISNTELTTL